MILENLEGKVEIPAQVFVDLILELNEERSRNWNFELKLEGINNFIDDLAYKNAREGRKYPDCDLFTLAKAAGRKDFEDYYNSLLERGNKDGI